MHFHGYIRNGLKTAANRSSEIPNFNKKTRAGIKKTQ